MCGFSHLSKPSRRTNYVQEVTEYHYGTPGLHFYQWPCSFRPVHGGPGPCILFTLAVGSESHLVEEGKAYRVRAESKISYGEYLSPDADNYHRYHEREPCAPVEMVKGHAAISFW